MTQRVPSTELIARVRAGELGAIARLMTRAESGLAESRPALAQIYQQAGRAHVIGITGVPGSGKSTLVSVLTRKLRERDNKVGIVAIDPSSPYSGGAILGDRIRMTDLVNDPGVFVRSMATHGTLGGMARAALDVVDILDVAGFDIVILETVGVGQDEVDIARASHTTVVVSAPGLGDGIQAIKAGILEIADIHVVSKCDRSDANFTLRDLKTSMMPLDNGSIVPSWIAPIIGTSAITEEGFDDLINAIERHREIAFDHELGRDRRRHIAAFRLQKTAEAMLIDRFAGTVERDSGPLVERLEARESDPYSVAQELLNPFLSQE
ncbi:MAG: methylmalonyl Co-A mutase-associated GTPase MeaB [Proteobacteria bacterium]|nr:methylmalonyl Co-A mutase-associated GTPase MeaB [Pseudomonadota bacterium]